MFGKSDSINLIVKSIETHLHFPPAPSLNLNSTFPSNKLHDAAIQPGAKYLLEWLTTGDGRAFLAEREKHVLMVECGVYKKVVGKKEK